MKKISLFIIGLLFVFPVVVFADNEPNVDTVTASVNGSTISYSGTVVNGSTAVTCILYNSNNQDVDRLSSAVENNTFSGSIVAPSNGEYELRCAHYEGGTIKKASVEVNDPNNNNNNNNNNENNNNNNGTTSNGKEGSTTKTPNTGDNVNKYVGIFIGGIVGVIVLVGAIIILKKKNK